jgi:WD40 repeat protein
VPEVEGTVLSRDGRTLAVVGGNRETTLWDVSDAAHPARLGSALPGSGRPAEFSPDGRMLITGDEDKSMLWDLSDPVHPVQRAKDLPAIIVLVVAFAPDSRSLAISNIYDFVGKVTLWDVADPSRPAPRPVPVLSGDASNATAAAFSADGRYLAIGRSDGTMVVWDVSRPTEPVRLGQPLAGPGEPNGNTSALNSTVSVLAMTFSANGQTLATTNLAGTLILWDTTDIAAGHDLGPPVPLSGSPVLKMRFAPDGATLATIGEDDRATFWDLKGVADLQDHSVERACVIVGQGLDQALWNRYLPGISYQQTCS